MTFSLLFYLLVAAADSVPRLWKQLTDSATIDNIQIGNKIRLNCKCLSEAQCNGMNNLHEYHRQNFIIMFEVDTARFHGLRGSACQLCASPFTVLMPTGFVNGKG